MRIANPKPGYCSVCFAGTRADLRYVDFEVAFDGAPVLDRETLTIAVLPWNGDQPSHDDLYVCEPCLKKACELLGLEPEQHTHDLLELEAAKNEARSWREYAHTLENAVGDRPVKVDHRRMPRKKVDA